MLDTENSAITLLARCPTRDTVGPMIKDTLNTGHNRYNLALNSLKVPNGDFPLKKDNLTITDKWLEGPKINMATIPLYVVTVRVHYSHTYVSVSP